MADDPRIPLLTSTLIGLALGCGAAPAAEVGVAAPRSREPSSSSTAQQSPPAIQVDPELDAVRAWALSAAGREGAIIELVERGPDVDGETAFHVIARDGDIVLDASIPSTRASALAHWRVAELVELTRRERIDLLVRGDGWTLVAIDGPMMICGDAACVPCSALPAPASAGSFWCVRGECTGYVETDAGRIEEWKIDPARRRRRVTRSWPARPDELEGAWDAGARAERGRWQWLDGVERPAVLDHPRLAAPASRFQEDPDVGGAPCTPTVRSARRDDTVVRVVGCGGPSPLFDDSHWPAALVVTGAGHTETTPLLLTAPTPERIVPLGVLASDALGFMAGESDGGSPGGSSSESLWVLVPAGDARSPRLHRLELAGASSEGLGNQDDGEGYVVAIDRRRLTFEVVGPGLGRYTRCERWSGTHARRTDRWRGERHTEPLDIRVTFDPERGFEMSDADRELLDTRCAPE